MKKLKLKGIQPLSKEQMKKISGGDNIWMITLSCSWGDITYVCGACSPSGNENCSSFSNYNELISGMYGCSVIESGSTCTQGY